MKTFAEYYAKGDYLNAWIELEKVRGSVSPGLWHYNAGTVKAKLERPAEARYHYLESLSKGYPGEELQKNLSFVEDQLEVRTVEKPLELSDYGMKFALWAQNGFFTTISLLILICGLLILRREKKFIYLAVTLAGMAIPLGTSLWIRSWDQVINLEASEVREGPSAIFASRGELPPGIHLIAHRSGDWYEIRYPSRFRGWVKSKVIKELE